MQVQFYHLLTTPLDRALPKLLEKAYGGGFRCLVLAGSAAEAEHLDKHLWTYDQDSFLPHGKVGCANPEQQPIYITTETENPNAANLLVVTNGVRPDDLSAFERVLDMFDGRDENATAAARMRWQEYKNTEYDLSYIKQNEQGGWDKT